MSSIDFQSGFRKETVVVRVNQKEVFRAADVTTQLIYGLAEEIKLPNAVGPAQIEIDLERHGLSASFVVEDEGEFFVGINFERGRIQFINSNRPFGYG